MFNSNGKLILLHKNLRGVPKATKYDILLSPQFYILKREKVPVKYAFQAKKLAPSILEELLPDNFNYEFIVKKDGEFWQFFAYSPKEIEEYLSNCCNISLNKIGKIYFADQLNKVLIRVPIGVDEKNALTLIDNKATIVPRSMLSSDSYAKFTSRIRPKNGYNFKPTSKAKSNSKIDKGAIVASILFVLFGGVYIFEGLSYKKALTKEEQKISELLNDYPSLQGQMIRESIKNKYSKIELRERKVREFLDKYSQLTSKKSILDKLEIKEEKLIAQFSVEPSEINKIITIAKEAKLNAKKISNNKIYVEGVLKWVKTEFF